MFLEFDFTVARGLGDLHKEMCSMNIPLVLLGPQPAVRNVLNEATNTLIPHVPNERDLETLLLGMSHLYIILGYTKFLFDFFGSLPIKLVKIIKIKCV